MTDNPVTEVEEVDDTLQRVKKAHAQLKRHQDIANELLRIRRAGVEQLTSSQQMTTSSIASELEISRQAVDKILKSGPAPEREWLGTSALTIAVGEKREAPKDHGEPGAAVAKETLKAYNTLADTARDMGLKVEFETVPPPGLVDLNRDNLVVICGPRLSWPIQQILAGDKNITFTKQNNRWVLRDVRADIEFSSPSGNGRTVDYGYLARLPRPDGQGTFLYIAGLHATGTLGVAHWVSHHLSELHAEVGKRRFSTIIQVNFTPDGGVSESKRVAPLYRAGGGAS